jgi:hypothetical protein
MPQPVDFLNNIRPHFADRAIGVFFVPNAMYLGALENGYQTYDWYAYPDHLHMFSPRSLLCLAESTGFALLDVVSNFVEDASKRALVMASDAPVLRLIRDESLKQAWLGNELGFVITPTDSELAEEFRDRSIYTRHKCLRYGTFEKQVMDRVAAGPIPAAARNGAIEELEDRIKQLTRVNTEQRKEIEALEILAERAGIASKSDRSERLTDSVGETLPD